MSMDVEHGGAIDRRLLLTRLGIGLVQGLALFALSEAAIRNVWPVTDAPLFIALVVMLLAAGPVLLSGLGSLRPRALAIWAGVALLVTAAIGWNEGYRALNDFKTIPSPLVMVAVLVGLFVSHSLVVAAARDRGRIASYPTYFDVAWKHGVQLALALAFTGVFWAVLGLGAALFGMIGVKEFGQLLSQRWFSIPASALAFAAAVHLTDVRLGLIQGVRTVALTLLGWLLPLLAGLTLAFLAALPFTGLEPLWNTGNAAMILIGAGASLILLINAAYQDGGREKPLPAVLRWAMRLGSLLLPPLAALASYALWLRIGQYGLTIERIIAVAGVVVGACYAVGYAIAAVLPGPAMRRLETTNVATSFVGLAVLLALLSPVADPVRLSVDSQVARLEAGKVKPAEFDFEYLKFSSGAFGTKALAKLSQDKGEIGRLARAAQAMRSRSDPGPVRPENQQPVAQIKVWPAGKTMPDGVKAQWADLAGVNCEKDGLECELFVIDVNGDGRDEALLKDGGGGRLTALELDGSGTWVRRGYIDVPYCRPDRDIWAALRGGRFEMRTSPWREIVVDGSAMVMRPADACPPTESKPSAKPPVEKGGQAGGKPK